jgi:DNA polymerase II small subunit
LQDPTTATNTGEGVQGYSLLFRSRFEKLMRVISQRPDSKRVAKIESIKRDMRVGAGGGGYKPAFANNNNNSEYRELNGSSYSSAMMVAGLLLSRSSKKFGVEVEVDDYTGIIKAIAATDETKKQVANLAIDQAVMIELEYSKGMRDPLIKSVVPPDIPEHVRGKSKSESYAVLISDLHVGSKHFMRDQFLQFLDWLSSDDELVRKIKFLCIGGDIIDGIGIFPNQDKELIELDTTKQMEAVTALLAKVPKHMKMLVIPGNHDPGRRALPQPSIPIIRSEGLRKLENCIMLGNPALVELNGVKILMYHGQSLDDIIATTPGMSYSKPAQAMRVLLKARHLAPTYGERTPIAPEVEDMMVISEIPDILHSGHVHVTDLENYRGTLIVNSGAWQSQTKFQQTMGITPTPGIAIIVNLATLQPSLLNFN